MGIGIGCLNDYKLYQIDILGLDHKLYLNQKFLMGKHKHK